MRSLRSVLLVFAALIVLLFAVLPLAAQGDVPPAEGVPNADEAASLAEVIIAAVLASAFGTAPVTTFLVSLLKRALPVDARLLATGVALVLAALTAAATQFGFDVQLESLLDLVATAGPAIAGFVATLVGSSAWYEAARRVNAPVVSYSRTPRL